MSRLAQWCSRVFMVELNQKTEPIYFALSTKPIAHSNTNCNTELEALFGRGKLFALYTLCDDRVQSARDHAHLKNALTEDLPSGCDLLDTASFLPDVKKSLVRGFILRDNSALSTANRIVTQLQQKASVCVLTYTRERSGEYLCWAVTDKPEERERPYYVTPAPAPQHHPSTLNIINSDVFYQMENAYKVLQEVIVSYWFGLALRQIERGKNIVRFGDFLLLFTW